jgi:hypothetical protein
MFVPARRRLAHAIAVCLVILFYAEIGNSRPPTDTVRFEAKMDTAMAQLWAQMPQDSASPGVNLIGQTGPDCANAALRKARFALTEVGIQDAAVRAAIQTVDIGKDVLEHALGVPYAGAIGDVVGLYLESGSVEELANNLVKLGAEKVGQKAASGVSAGAGHVGGAAGTAVEHATEGYPAEKLAGEAAKKIWDGLSGGGGERTLFESTFNDPNCGPIAVVFEMRSGPNGRKSIHFRASGDCQCKWPTNVGRSMQMGKFTVVGNGELRAENPVIRGNSVIINYRLESTTYDVMASCGCPEGGDQSGTSVTEGPQTQPDQPKTPVYERICWQRCGHLYEQWQELQRQADRLADSVKRQEADLAQPRRDVQIAEEALQAAQNRLTAANNTLGKYNTATLQQNFPVQYHDAQTAVRTANEDVALWQNRLNIRRQDVADREARLARTQALATQRAAEAAQARDAYYRCIASCYDQAHQAGELREYPSDVEEWKKSHPPTPPPTSSRTELQSEAMLVGVVVGADTRTGEKTTARVVPNPKSFQNIPGLRVIEVATRVPMGTNGKPDIEKLQARIGDGPVQPCDGPLTGTVPGNGQPLRVTVGQPGQTPGTGEIPVTPGPPRTAPAGVRPNQFRTPAMLQRGTVGVVHGPFDGRNLGTSVTVGGKQAEILAETGNALYFIVPGSVQPGQAAVVVEEQGTRISFRVAAIGLQMSAGRLQLEKGQSATFAATVTGADHLPATAWQAGDPGEFSDLVNLEEVRRMAPNLRPPAKGAPGMVVLLLQNMSPQVVSMSGGMVVQQQLGQSAFSAGPYTYNGSVSAHEKGSFSIKGTVIPFLAPVAGE